MGLNTYPYSPFPASTEQLHKGDNEQIQAEIDQVKSDLTDLSEEVTGNATVYPYADVITIEDAVPANLADCSVKIEPVQSGSGDPSPTNVRPITGHTEVDVQRDGKNLWEFAESYSGAGGLATNLRFSNSLKPNTYVLSCKGTFTSGGAIQFTFMCEDGSKSSITLGYDKVGDTYYSSRTFTKKIVGIDNIYSNNAGNSINDVQLELGSSATDYEPFKGKTYTIALGDTIYGGTVDFDSGVMTVTQVSVDIDGDTIAAISGQDFGDNTRFFIPYPEDMTGKYVTTSSICKCDSARVSFNDTINSPNLATENAVYPHSSGIFYTHIGTMTTRDFNTWLASNNVQVCYELATPFTVQLTPQQIQLLKGTNTLYASTGQISVTVNGVSGAIGAVQEQANTTDAALAELAADIAEQLPDAPTTDGAYVLTVTVESGTPTYSWESAE